MRLKSRHSKQYNVLILLVLLIVLVLAILGIMYLRERLDAQNTAQRMVAIELQTLVIRANNDAQEVLQNNIAARDSLINHEKRIQTLLNQSMMAEQIPEWNSFLEQLRKYNRSLNDPKLMKILSSEADFRQLLNKIRILAEGEFNQNNQQISEGLLSKSRLTGVPEEYLRLAYLASGMEANLALLYAGNRAALLKFERELRDFRNAIATVVPLVQPNTLGSAEVREIISFANLLNDLDNSAFNQLRSLYDEAEKLRLAADMMIKKISDAIYDGTIFREMDTIETPLGHIPTYAIWGLIGLCALTVGCGLFVLYRMGRADIQIDQEQVEQNRRNEESILSLLDVMTDLASGDLTVQAKVTDDITGTIADSFNYTIEELRGLVGTVKNSSAKVTEALIETSAVADKLADASYTQAAQITEASSVVARMNQAMIDVSAQTAASVEIAMNSTEVARSGAERVRMTIAGMDQIREHIQETSKRIKRLGESSQEIGDIVELIQDIADQTHLLALNAAIQASTAGEAGRGFAVVADEVQRLAERTSNATKRVESLVKAIQADTNEAINAMEKSTSEVVNGANLAERAGESLNEIESVSVRLATLIKNVSHASREVSSLGERVREGMDSVRNLTEQNVESTAITTRSVEQLNDLASELRRSVSGFIIP